MSEIIDKKDLRLIYHLSDNARQSQTQLAKKVGLSKNAIKYRIERLKKTGVIKNFSATVNLGSLGLTTYTMLLRFNEDIYKDKSIINFFKEHGFVDWSASLSGQWDLFVEFVSRDYVHFENTISEIISFFGDKLNSYRVFFSRDTLRVEHLIHDLYSNLELPKFEHKMRNVNIDKIDKTDKQILNLLCEDSSLNFHEIATKLKLTLDIVRYRIKNLVNNQTVVKFSPEIMLDKLGYTEYLYIIKLNNSSSENIKLLKNKIQHNHNITYAFFDIASLSLIFVCAFKNAEGIDTLSRGLRGEFSNIIEHQEYNIIKEQISFNLFPKGLID
jgi:DNA-binding Lrp family transcriptional regulator